MPKLSLRKLNEIKDSKLYTLKEISQITKIPHSTIAKIFSGFNKNPQIESLLKIANALECGIDDFIDYEQEPKSDYYINRKTDKIASRIYENSDLKRLFDASQYLFSEDIRVITVVAERLLSKN